MKLDELLSEGLPHYVPRESQRRMSQDVANLIESSATGLMEAGTGTGKTFAYLVPTLASSRRVLISTGTKNLQDQLVHQDIPLVNQYYRRRVALLKGRANYLCRERLEQHLRVAGVGVEQQTLAKLTELHDWSIVTKSGDLTEVMDPETHGGILPLVTSTTDNCLNHRCPKFDGCFLFRARERARQADVLVVNHHLLFAGERENPNGLMADFEVAVLDEAHQIPAIASQFFGERVGSRQFHDLVRDINRELTLLGADDTELLRTGMFLDARVKELSDLFLRADGQRKFSEVILNEEVQCCIDVMDDVLARLNSILEVAGPRSPGLAKCYHRAIQLADSFTTLTEVAASLDTVQWIDVGVAGFTLHQSPVDVAGQLGDMLARQGQTRLLVSATLTTDDDFAYFRRQLGLEEGLEEGRDVSLVESLDVNRLDSDCSDSEAFVTDGAAPSNKGCDKSLNEDLNKRLKKRRNRVLEHRYPSAFDLERQVCGFVPPGLPDPRDGSHTLELMRVMVPLLKVNTGRTFMLFTSYRALNLAAELLAQEHNLTLLVQGSLSRSELLVKFRELPHAILLATQSFWQGIDVGGAALRCLVIDKLPFHHPDDPMTKARLLSISDKGGDPFNDYTLPEATIALRQGFGRLIRRESDRGLFVLGDRRLEYSSYGARIRASLPAFKWLEDPVQAREFLASIGP